jgi:hypothetical protein
VPFMIRKVRSKLLTEEIEKIDFSSFFSRRLYSVNAVILTIPFTCHLLKMDQEKHNFTHLLPWFQKIGPK